MSLELHPLHPEFAVEIAGVDMGEPLSMDQRIQLTDAIEKYGVALLRDQPLENAAQIRFSESFGPLDIGFKKASNSPSRLQYEELLDMSNVGVDDKIVPRDHRKIVGNIANQLWHSDSSFQKPVSTFSFLLGVVIPGQGGETEFVDTRVAFEALTAGQQAELEGLVARHDPLHSRVQLGDTNYSPEQRAAIEPAEWPILRTGHPSGRTGLYIGAHAHEVIGMTVPEGRMLLSDLLEHATRPERVYRHEWRVGDLVIWDNRVTLHRGRRFDFTQRRELRRTTVLETAA